MNSITGVICAKAITFQSCQPSLSDVGTHRRVVIGACMRVSGVRPDVRSDIWVEVRSDSSRAFTVTVYSSKEHPLTLLHPLKSSGQRSVLLLYQQLPRCLSVPLGRFSSLYQPEITASIWGSSDMLLFITHSLFLLRPSIPLTKNPDWEITQPSTGIITAQP